MPDLIPYFTAALKDHKRKDKLYAIAIEIGKTWDKEDDITLIRRAALGCEALLLIYRYCKELTISKGYLKEEIKLLRKLE
jgi:hypothetical protein